MDTNSIFVVPAIRAKRPVPWLWSHFRFATDVYHAQAANTFLYVQVGYWALWLGYKRGQRPMRIELFTSHHHLRIWRGRRGIEC